MDLEAGISWIGAWNPDVPVWDVGLPSSGLAAKSVVAALVGCVVVFVYVSLVMTNVVPSL